MIGQTLSHFKITAKIGEGGMGEVYRAQDTKLGREVALKVLPEHFARDSERMARFQREAQVLASLNHPHIAAIHGLEEVDGQRFLVLELVEGETLEDRITRGALPVDEALPLALQIAQALEAAHEKGIVHRDLKPANVKLTAAGQVKVLDFGLAKALAGDPDSPDSQPDLTQSPTLTAMTAAGVLMGTAAYMSPEQARGKAADRRADVWAFGVVLLEMLTGHKTFPGDTATDVLGGIVHKEPEWERLPAATPAPIRTLLRRCLRKDASRRLHDIADARIVLQDYLEDPTAAEAVAEAPSAPTWRRALPWTLLGAATAALVASVVILWPEAPEPRQTVRVETNLAQDSLFSVLGASAVLSPDGSRLAYITGTPAGTEMYLRTLDQLDGTRLAAGPTANAPYHPFFSPDGQWLGFVTPSELKKIPITGGTPITLCPVGRSRGASWGPDGTVVFAPEPNSALHRVPATGGEAEPITVLDEEKGEVTHRWPQFLPGGKAVLFTSHSEYPSNFDSATIEAVVLETGERKIVHRGGYYGRYAPSGHLLYVNDGTLFAIPFDPGRLETSGSAAPVVQGIAVNASEAGAQYSFSQTGSLAYVQGDSEAPEYPVVWVDRDGVSGTLWEERGAYGQPRLSPDGSRLALSVLRDQNLDVWVYDLERGVATRLTFHETYDGDQVWSPDGEYLVFSSHRDGVANLYRKRADGSGEAERLSNSPDAVWPNSWSADGTLLTGHRSTNSDDIWVFSLDGEGDFETFLETAFSESYPTFSPDGRWIAYQSNESGRFEVYVRPYPPGGGKWQVSDGGGGQPRWSADGRELFYRTDEGLMVVSIDTAQNTLRAAKPRPVVQTLFRGSLDGVTVGPYTFTDYDVAPDGRRFVTFPQETDDFEEGQVVLVLNWFDELKRLLGDGR